MTCPDCGALVVDRATCDAAFHELGIRAAEDARFAYRRRAVVDAYCLQHDAYVLSIKSLAAHLCGLCAAMERAADPRAERAVWSGLKVPPGAVKPPLPSHRGEATVATVAAAGAERYPAAVDAWLASVWAAYAPLHPTARAWLDHSVSALRR